MERKSLVLKGFDYWSAFYSGLSINSEVELLVVSAFQLRHAKKETIFGLMDGIAPVDRITVVCSRTNCVTQDDLLRVRAWIDEWRETVLIK